MCCYEILKCIEFYHTYVFIDLNESSTLTSQGFSLFKHFPYVGVVKHDNWTWFIYPLFVGKLKRMQFTLAVYRKNAILRCPRTFIVGSDY